MPQLKIPLLKRDRIKQKPALQTDIDNTISEIRYSINRIAESETAVEATPIEQQAVAHTNQQRADRSMNETAKQSKKGCEFEGVITGRTRRST